MKRQLTLAGVIALSIVAAAPPAGGQDAERTPAARTISKQACAALEDHDFTKVQDAPTQVMRAVVLPAQGIRPAACHVQGYVAPQVGFEFLLPVHSWNGKFIQVGCGGNCGTTRFNGQLLDGLCDEMLRRGYACIGSDRGHHTSRDGMGNAFGDSLWAYDNLQAEVDFGFRATHVVTLAGKAIAAQLYGEAPRYSYMLGCSGGGRQGLMEAQRFPWDFDGIVALEPSVNGMMAKLTTEWIARVTTDAQGQPLFSAADVDLLHNAVLAACDGNDGLKDGVINDPPSCRFRVSSLACTPDRTSACFTPNQVKAAELVYAGPQTSSGKRIFYGPNLGAEKGPLSFAVTPKLANASAKAFGYMAFMPDPGPGWTQGSFDFDRDYKRMGMMEALLSADNPDLRRFKRAGGKLIIAHGWDDSGTPLARGTIDYYEAVARAMGGQAKTQDFARLFMIPGRGHCTGGPGANAVDFLAHLEAWVERGEAPDMMIAGHVEGDSQGDFITLPHDRSRVKFTRPLYPYPLQARYKGRGDPNDYRSFVSYPAPLKVLP
ncbi:tannase/feruloyl esterase family alpha/beta hydrolase [Novosphingobium mathurense]|uniref:Feruloyl esterase n=1 Tax=Novosphingobium mathurense TaxID=428990 RepID=A0A1U6IL54_9SPHN|nr:tannase/feruloyl esterase family alpha/beta hydrolase [Novosphingobium mathurense]SLK08748.1 feruloyl esterase [Novosphingobium mathurense]